MVVSADPLATAGDPQPPELLAPGRLPVRSAERSARSGPGEPLEAVVAHPRARGEIGEVKEGATTPALLHQDSRLLLDDALDVAEADADGRLATCHRLHRALHLAAIHVHAPHLDPAPLRLVGERVGWVEAHRLLVEEGAEQLGPIV